MDARIRSHFRTNPKVASLSLEAKGLWLEGLLYACANDTGGHIPTSALPIAGSIADQLVASRLWHIDGDGWRIHDFYQWNPEPTRRQLLLDAVARGAGIPRLRDDYARQITPDHLECDITPEEVEAITRFILASWGTQEKVIVGLPKFDTILATRGVWRARRAAPVNASAYMMERYGIESRGNGGSPGNAVRQLEEPRHPGAARK